MLSFTVRHFHVHVLSPMKPVPSPKVLKHGVADAAHEVRCPIALNAATGGLGPRRAAAAVPGQGMNTSPLSIHIILYYVYY